MGKGRARRYNGKKYVLFCFVEGMGWASEYFRENEKYFVIKFIHFWFDK